MLKGENMLERLEQCKLCPHKCNVNRLRGKIGKCKATDKVKISDRKSTR